jgi:hypothetical protein
MKSFIFLFFVLASIQTLNAQIPSSCNVLPVLQTYYDRDVKHLALKRIYNFNAPAMDSITIPQNYQDTVWQALAAIFNLNNNSARDTVFDIYCIHQSVSSYIFYQISVQLESSCSWLQNWQNLITTTGIPALDTMLSSYGFTVTQFYPAYNDAILTTSQTINVRPLCDSVETFGGVVYAEPRSIMGDGDEVRYSKTGSNQSLDFVIGYGDCSSGCIGSLTFHFGVNENCDVQYFGSHLIPDYSSPFPPAERHL